MADGDHIRVDGASWTGPANATVNCAASTETTLVEVTGVTGPTDVVATLNLKNLTVDATLTVYEHVFNGTTTEYQKVKPTDAWAVADALDGVRVAFTAQADYKITITTGAEGAARDVYVRHSRKAGA